MKINNNILPMYQNNIEKKNMLIIINRRRRKETLCSYQRFYYFHELLYFTTCKKTFLSILLKNFQYFQKKYFKNHTKDCFKINEKQRTIMPRKGEFVKFKNNERKK